MYNNQEDSFSTEYVPTTPAQPGSSPALPPGGSMSEYAPIPSPGVNPGQYGYPPSTPAGNFGQYDAPTVAQPASWQSGHGEANVPFGGYGEANAPFGGHGEAHVAYGHGEANVPFGGHGEANVPFGGHGEANAGQYWGYSSQGQYGYSQPGG